MKQVPVSAALTAIVFASLLLAPPVDARPSLSDLQAAIEALNARLETLETENEALTLRIGAVEGENEVLINKLACVSNASNSINLYFDGCNVHVRNGVGQTNSVNGRGNLLVGYDKARNLGSDKTGSHNLVVGDEHNYISYGGFVAGFRNSVTGQQASVLGGDFNVASGLRSSVSGGVSNTASGFASTIGGGFANTAMGAQSSVSGGRNRLTTGTDDWQAGSLFEDF